MAERQMPDPNELPPNSHQYRRDQERAAEQKAAEGPEEEKNDIPKQSLSGGVTQRKRSLQRRFMDIFFKDGASAQEIKAYIIEEVLVPAVLENIADAINAAVEMRFFGAARRRKGSKGSQTGTRMSYGSFYSGGNDSKRERIAKSTKEMSGREPLDDYIFDSLSDAERVLVDMRELLDHYDQVTVADYLDILRSYGISINVRPEHTDNKFGWTDLSTVKPIRARGGGYFLDLPREYPL